MWSSSLLSVLARAAVRAAALRAPGHLRDAMIREWVGELEEEALREGGWSALRAAWGAFADAGELRAQWRIRTEAQGRGTMIGWLRGWSGDVTVALRSLRRTPGFTAVAVLTLALGIGGSAAIFTLLDRAVLKPLPYPHADRLVRLDNQVPGVGPDEIWAMSVAQMVYFSQHAKSLDAVGIYSGTGGNIMTPSGPERVSAVRVTQSMMGLLGAKARLGRLISPDDDTPSSPAVALVSQGFWTRVLGSDPGVVGTTLTYNDSPVEVIGVLDDGVRLPGSVNLLCDAEAAPDVWMPMRINLSGPFRNSHVYPGIARLADGATPRQAETELARLTPALPKLFPSAYTQGFIDHYGFRT